MSDEMPKIDPGTPKKRDAGFLGTGIGNGVVVTVVALIVARGVLSYIRTSPQREKARAAQMELERQRQEGMRLLEQEIRNTPPDKMGKAMKMLLGIKDDQNGTEGTSSAKPATSVEQPTTATRGE